MMTRVIRMKGGVNVVCAVWVDDCKCATCKKNFVMRDKKHWAYKVVDNGLIKKFCSYGCMRQYQKSHNMITSSKLI